jgi:hypothetical protein
MQIWRGESHFFKNGILANVGEYGESCQTAWQMSASLANFLARSFYVQKDVFKYKTI